MREVVVRWWWWDGGVDIGKEGGGDDLGKGERDEREEGKEEDVMGMMDDLGRR